MSEQPETYQDDEGPEAAGMVGPAHEDDGTNPGDAEEESGEGE